MTTFDVSLMDYAPVPFTTALSIISTHYTVIQSVVVIHFLKLDPGSSQVMFEDDTLMDFARLPFTTALPGILTHFTVIQTVVIINFF